MSFNFGVEDTPIFYKILTYMGSKDKHISIINDLILKSNKKNYCEPFLGSGSIFLNLQKTFDSYYLNDLCKPMMDFYFYKDILTQDYCKEIFDNIENNYNLKEKEDYYKFRDFYNSYKESPEKALYFLLVAAHSINGMIRFNSKGEFNQGCGNRKYNRERVLSTLEKIQFTKNVIPSCKDYMEVVKPLKDTLIFLDPPYVDAKMANDGGFCNEKLIELLDYIQQTDNDIIYTDTLNDFNKNLKGFTSQKICDMIGTRPRKGRESTEEYLFYKISH